MIDVNEAYGLHQKKWKNCHDCTIGRWAFKHCFGNGSLSAKFVFIGEGPGASEDALGMPFVGPAGKLLVKAVCMAGFVPDECFLTNLVACRPTDVQNGPNRVPSSREVANCSSRLEEVVKIIKPKHIIAVGSVPAGYLLGRVGQFGGLQAVYSKIKHPAWVLRQGGERSEAWGDFVDSLKEIKRRAR